jgi:hypothetical protein
MIYSGVEANVEATRYAFKPTIAPQLSEHLYSGRA